MSSRALASTKSSAGMKFRITKISSKCLDGISAKICTNENFLLYCIVTCIVCSIGFLIVIKVISSATINSLVHIWNQLVG